VWATRCWRWMGNRTMWVATMDDRTPENGGANNNRTNNNRPRNTGAGPGTGDPNAGYPGGSPVDVRDGTIRPHSPLEGGGGRVGEPIPGLSSEAAERNTIRSTITPDVNQPGWSAAGMAIPSLLVVALILALVALLL